MNIYIRDKRTLNGETVEMTDEQKLRLNRYLNKYFREFWQQVNATPNKDFIDWEKIND